MSVQINVRIDEHGPAGVRLRQASRLGRVLELEREDPYLIECEQDAYERLLGQGHRLPAGSIDVLVAEDEFRHYPSSAAVGRAIASAS